MIRKIETIENQFIEQIQSLLYNSFPKAVGFKVNYCIGEEEQQEGKKGLYIEVISKKFGLVYKKFKPMLDHQVVADVEDMFINNVINDLILAGMTFLNAEAITKRTIDKIGHEVSSKEFKSIIPSRIIFMN